MVLVERKRLAVIKGGRFPFVGSVALATLARDLAMQSVGWDGFLVAGQALLSFGKRQDVVLERCRFPPLCAVTPSALVARYPAVQGIGWNLRVVAGCALIPLADRQHFMFERRRLPLLDVVALQALVLNPFVEGIHRSLVTGQALLPSRGFEKPMRELLLYAVLGYALMIAVAGNAVVLQ